MGDPIHPTPADRASIRALSASIVEAVRNDEPMPLGLEVHRHGRMFLADDVEALVMQLAQEVEALTKERDRAMHVVEAVAWAEADDRIGHLKVYPNDGNDTFPDGERAKYLGEYASELMSKAVTACRKKDPNV